MQRSFQLANKLPVTGLIDEKTEKRMKAPRCGLPDILKKKQNKMSKFSIGMIYMFKINFSLYLLFYFVIIDNKKWSKNNLTWKLLNYTSDLKKLSIE
jgi:hypothetical protein